MVATKQTCTEVSKCDVTMRWVCYYSTKFILDHMTMLVGGASELDYVIGSN